MAARAQRARFHGQWQYLFIESICNDQAVLEQNYRYKMMYSPDYAGADSEEVRCYQNPWTSIQVPCRASFVCYQICDPHASGSSNRSASSSRQQSLQATISDAVCPIL